MNNSKRLTHAETLPLVTMADEIRVKAMEVKGEDWSTIGLLLSAIEMIHDTEEYDLQLLVTATEGYAVEFDDLMSKDQVIDHFERAFEILEAPIYEDED